LKFSAEFLDQENRKTVARAKAQRKDGFHHRDAEYLARHSRNRVDSP
jgi:hypothetical protein